MARLIYIPEDQYHADPCDKPSLSASMCKVLVQKTPKHAWMKHPKLGAQEIETEDEDEEKIEHGKFDLGKAAHALLLEGVDKMQIVDAKDWRTNDAKAERKEADEAGKIALLRYQYNNVVNMKNAAIEYIARSGFKYQLKDFEFEQTIIFNEDTEFPRRSRLDALSHDKRMIFDYKSTKKSLRYDSLRRHIEDMGYDITDAFYKDAVQALGGRRPEKVFLFQEARAPYLCQFVSLDSSFKMLGESKKNYACALWEECMAENWWPGYLNGVISLEPSAWSHANWDERMELEGMIDDEKPMVCPIDTAMKSEINYMRA